MKGYLTGSSKTSLLGFNSGFICGSSGLHPRGGGGWHSLIFDNTFIIPQETGWWDTAGGRRYKAKHRNAPATLHVSPHNPRLIHMRPACTNFGQYLFAKRHTPVDTHTCRKVIHIVEKSLSTFLPMPRTAITSNSRRYCLATIKNSDRFCAVCPLKAGGKSGMITVSQSRIAPWSETV
jgi:hypothetical protein